jgi:hypothetical protein
MSRYKEKKRHDNNKMNLRIYTINFIHSLFYNLLYNLKPQIFICIHIYRTQDVRREIDCFNVFVLTVPPSVKILIPSLTHDSTLYTTNYPGQRFL